MSVASTLLDQTEGLQSRLDRAMIKHNLNTDPDREGRLGELKEGTKVFVGILSAGASNNILNKGRLIREHEFRTPYDVATMLLRQIAAILTDGTETLDASRAFQQNLPQLRSSLGAAATQVGLAEKAA